MRLEIISPEKTLFSGDVELVTLPGMAGKFTILNNHAPIISSLIAGRLTYRAKGEDNELEISGGFIESKSNTITVCID